MVTYRESGLEVTLPDAEGFRFCDCPAYRDLSRFSLKEMDFGWWDNSKDTLWLLELKDYSRLTEPERLPVKLFDNLTGKATDSLMMLSSVWFGSSQGTEIGRSLPPSCRIFPAYPKTLKIIFVLKLPRHPMATELSALTVRLRNRLQGRVALFDMAMTDVVLVDHKTAMKVGLPIQMA